jgi:hypothetical protein
VVTNWDKLPENVRAELRGTLISMGLGITQIGGLVDFGRMLITGKAVPFGEAEATFTDQVLAGAGALPFVKLGTAGAKAVDAFADAARILNITEDLVAAAAVAPRGMTIAENLRPFLGTSTVTTVEQLLVSPGSAGVANAGAALAQTLTANFDQVMAAAAVPGKLTLAGVADAALWAKPSDALIEASAHSMPYTDLVTLWASKNNLAPAQAFGAVTTQLDGTIAMVASGKWTDPVSGLTHNIEPAVQTMQLRQLVAAREELEIARAISDAGIKLKPGEIAADVLGRLPDAIVDTMQSRIDAIYKAAGIRRGG